MPTNTTDPCGHVQPDPGSRIYIPGDPSRRRVIGPVTGGCVSLGEPPTQWLWPLQLPTSRLYCGGGATPVWSQVCAYEIRRGADAVITVAPWQDEPGPGWYGTEFPTIVCGLTTIWAGRLIDPPLPLPTPSTYYYPDDAHLQFPWTVHSDQMQAIVIASRGWWARVGPSYGYRTNATRVTVSF